MSRRQSTWSWAALALVLGASIGCTDDSTAPPKDRGGPFGRVPVETDVDGGSDASKDASRTDARLDGAASDSKDGPAAADGKDAPVSGGSGGASGGGGNGGGGVSGSGGAPMANPAECLKCEEKYCKKLPDSDLDEYSPCYMPAAPTTAQDGPKKGTAKTELCQAVLDCVRQSNCIVLIGDMFNAQGCYCGAGVSDISCLSGNATGPCKTQIGAAAETSDSGEVGDRLVDFSYASGAAINLLQDCDPVFCKTSCLGKPGGDGPPVQSGSGGTTAASGGTSGSGGATGSGGASAGSGGASAGSGGAGEGSGGSGSGGSGSGGSGGSGSGSGGTTGSGGSGNGSGGASGSGGAGNGPVTYNQCHACEQTTCSDELAACEGATGNAMTGPGMGRPRKDLCLELLACIRRTACGKPATGDVQPCYCGTTSDLACLTGGANGQCKAEVEAAAESSAAADVASRFTDLDPSGNPYPLGAAYVLYACDHDVDHVHAGVCDSPCTNGDPLGGAGGAPGSGGASGSGGAPGSGGASGSGGTPASGGASGSGGTPASGGATGSGGTPGSGGASGSGGTPASGGASGSGGAAGSAGMCPDLDTNNVPDCHETLISNPGFDANTSAWLAEFGANQSRDSRDATGVAGSGSLSVTNANIADADGMTMTGSRQCVPVTGGTTYRLFLQQFIPPGQGVGTGGVNIIYYPSIDCSGAMVGADAWSLLADTNAWKLVQGTTSPPAGTQSMAVRLVAMKTFRAAAFQILFDNLLLKAQ